MLFYVAVSLLGTILTGYIGVKLLCPWLLVDFRYILKMIPPMKKYFDCIKRKVYLVDVFEEQARKIPDKTFLVWRDKEYTYKEVDDRANQIARAALKIGIKKGDTVALMMYNEPAFIWIYLAMLKIAAPISLINTNQRAKTLQHSISVSATNVVIVGPDADLQDALVTVLPEFPDLAVYTSSLLAKNLPSCFSTKLRDIAMVMPTDSPDVSIRADVKPTDPAVYIFTSGTTGLPKAAHVAYSKLVTGMFLAEIFDFRSSDRIFTCMPLYHTSALLFACSATISTGATLVVEKKFSKTTFLDTCRKHNVTVVCYVGELCRYLLTTEKGDLDTDHSIRLAIGNGMRQDIWTDFRVRFNIREIKEFYGSTEGTGGMFNLEGVPGACGRLSPFMKRVVRMGLYKWDFEKESLVRDANGHCVPVSPGTPGLLLSAINKTMQFAGYKGKKELTESKFVRNVIKDGDLYYNSGDVMVQDSNYYVYFSDRVGDTFRWKGENVSTTEVSNCLTELHFVVDAAVYGVTIPGCDGKAGMASLLTAPDHKMDDASLEEFRQLCKDTLPTYAHPLFLRVHRDQLDMTSTLKQNKVRLKSEGFNVNVIKEDVYYLDKKAGFYKRLTESTMSEIVDGRVVF